MKRILFQIGGPWHPVDAQAALDRLDDASLANGHALESMEPPAIRQLWLNTLHWLPRA